MKLFPSFPLAVCCLFAIALAALPAISGQFSSVRALSAAQATTQKKPTKKSKKPLSADEIARLRNIERRADSVLLNCRQQIEGESRPFVKTYRADIVQRVKIGRREFTARGSFVKGTGLKRRLDLRMEFGPKGQKTRARLLQICDGQVLTTQQIINGTPRITRRDVQRILNFSKEIAQTSEVSRIRALGLGGLGGLLASLQQTMTFDKFESKTVDSKQVFLLEGTWNERFRQRLDSIRRNGQLPEHVPDRVRVEIHKEPNGIGKEDFNDVLRQIQYLKKDPKSDSHYPLMTLTLQSIQLNRTDLAPDPKDKKAIAKMEKLFRYTAPKGAYEETITEGYINQLKQAAEAASRNQRGR